MTSPVVYQPIHMHDKMLPDKKTLDKMIDNEKTFLPDKRFLRKVSPTSEALMELLDRVDRVVINQKVETALGGMLTLGCCKVKNVYRENILEIS